MTTYLFSDITGTSVTFNAATDTLNFGNGYTAVSTTLTQSGGGPSGDLRRHLSTAIKFNLGAIHQQQHIF